MQELSGGAPTGVAPARIEAGPGHNAHGGASDGVKPWEQRPTGGPAPWQQRDRGNDFNDRGGYGGGFSSRDPPPGPSGGPAPWARDRTSRGDERRNDNYGNGRDNGYNGYSGGGGAGYSGGGAPWQQSAPPPPPPSHGGYGGAYGQAPGYSAPHSSAPWQQAAPPPPPPSGFAPPPPPSDHAPPPPPPGN